jgi:hypothetical protein
VNSVGSTEEEKRSIFYRIEHVDPRVIRWPVAILMVIVYLTPMVLPMKVTSSSEAYLAAIDAVPAGGVIVMDCGVSFGGLGELMDGMMTTAKYLAQKDVRVLYWSFASEDAIGIFTDYFVPAYLHEGYGDPTKQYGVDYVYVGQWTRVYEPACAALASDIYAQTGGKDYYGDNLADMAVMEGVTGAEDIDLIISVDDAGPVKFYVAHWNMRFGTPIITACIAIFSPEYTMYYEAGQVAGILHSTRGCAEFDVLTGIPGVQLQQLNVLSICHVYIMIILIIANIGFFYRRLTGKEEVESREERLARELKE